MTTKTIKTADLAGAALDWAVVHAEGIATPGRFLYGTFNRRQANLQTADCIYDMERTGTVRPHSPSTFCDLGGPIIDRERIGTVPYESDEAGQPCEPGWFAFIHWEDQIHGPTRLIAAMRCYVASKLGGTVDIPQELSP